MAFCSKCGTQIADGVRFCPSCGNDVSGTPNAQQANTNQVNISKPNTNQANMNQGNAYQGNMNQGNMYQNNMNQNNYGQQSSQGSGPAFMNTLDTTNQYHPQDIADNKVMAILSYLGFLWLIPCFAAKQSPFARYHVKQGFLVICSQIGYEIIAAILVATIRVKDNLGLGFYTYHTPGILVLILWLLRLVIWAMAVIGIINAVQGKAKELPFIGKFAANFTFLN